MAGIWSDENKLARWLDVELAALEAWAETGEVPADAVVEIRARAQPRPGRRRGPGRGDARAAAARPHPRDPCRADHVRPQARGLGLRARPRPRPPRAGARGDACWQALRRRRHLLGDGSGGRAPR